VSTRGTRTKFGDARPGGRVRGAEGPTARATSADGTQIAYWSSGSGPPLVVVHGAIADHTRWRPILPFLEPHSTVHAMDRRGRGGSGDHLDYALAREFEDVAAVVDSIAETTGSAVDVYGHSYGGLCAFGAATLTTNIRRLVLYEGWPAVDPARYALARDVEERLEALLAEGNPEAVVETTLRDIVHAPEHEITALRGQPSWPARVAAAHTVTRELRAMADASLDPEQAATITAPTLLLSGSESSDLSTADIAAMAGALPDARVEVIEGQHHVADVMAPGDFARRVVRFLQEPGS
jgi:pimeloyl-ACP methyl ester carboxylesterase